MRDQVFRDLMAAVCAPVTVVTTMGGTTVGVTSAGEAGPHGATVSAFASLSLRPPLVTVALDRRSALLARIQQNGRFGVNVLGAGDDEIALRFASPVFAGTAFAGPVFASTSAAGRFAGVPWTPAHGLPRLDCAAAWAECELAQVVDGGDHLLLIGLVTHAESRQAAPLVYGHRTFGTHSRFASRPRRPIDDTIAACAR
jgi:flavin reductase (DIM6/NTAB) family NADH-FMN oxidoreductase RutF